MGAKFNHKLMAKTAARIFNESAALDRNISSALHDRLALAINENLYGTGGI